MIPIVAYGPVAFEYMSMEKNETVQYPAFFGFAPSPPISPADAKNGHNIRKEVIDQLLAVRSTKEYRPVVDNAAMLLATSPNTSLRELELYLTQEGKVSDIIPRQTLISNNQRVIPSLSEIIRDLPILLRSFVSVRRGQYHGKKETDTRTIYRTSR